MDEGENSLEDLELYVYTLRHAVVRCLNDGWHRREGDGAQRAEGKYDNFGIFHCMAHEDGSVWQPSVVIKIDLKSLAGISQSDSQRFRIRELIMRTWPRLIFPTSRVS